MSQFLVFMGPPGAGKGSLAQHCLEHYQWQTLSTGALCRKHIIDKTPLGQTIAFTIQSGNLIEDELMISMLRMWLEENILCKKSFILDGFPRTPTQAALLLRLMKENFSSYSLTIIRFVTTPETVMYRLAGRAVCENQDCQIIYSLHDKLLESDDTKMKCTVCGGHLMRRVDDEESSVIANRLNYYYQTEDSLLEFYANNSVKVIDLMVNKSSYEVFQDFDALMKINAL